MTKINYPGIADPEAAFAVLEPHRQALDAMKRRYPPASSQYRALSHAIMTLDVAANLITGRLQFYDTGFRDTGPIGSTRRDG